MRTATMCGLGERSSSHLVCLPFTNMLALSYVTFAKAGGGFTLSDFQYVLHRKPISRSPLRNVRERRWMRDYHEDHWITFDRKKPLTWPTFIRFSDRGVEDKRESAEEV